MVPGSRFIPALFGEKKISTVGQLEHAKEKSHDAVREGQPAQMVCSEDRSAAAENENPSKHFHPTGHEKASRVECAPVQDDPGEGKPHEMPPAGVRRNVRKNYCSDNESCSEWRRQRLSDAPRGRRPEGFSV